MSNATIAERRERYHKAQGKRGLVEVRVWVPAASRDALRLYAANLRHPKPRKDSRRNASRNGGT